MKTMKKLTVAFLTAAMITNTFGIVHASAYAPYNDLESYQRDELGMGYELSTDGYGTMFFKDLNWYRSGDFLAVTTSEGLPETYTDDCGDTYAITEWKDFKLDYATVALDTGALQAKYGDDIRMYLVDPSTYHGDETYWSCREFALRNESVLGTLLLESKMEGTGYWRGTYELGIRREISSAENPEMTPEDSVLYTASLPDAEALYKGGESEYRTWKGKFTAWYDLVNSASMTGEERMASLAEAGITDPYTVMMDAREKVKAFLAAHADVYDTCTMGIIPLGKPILLYQTFSAWSYMGDLDEDGTVTAADASEMLKAGALSGAGLSNGLTTEQRETGDLNSDYRINAEDAALTLLFAAEQGSDPKEGEDIGDFVLRQYRGR